MRWILRLARDRSTAASRAVLMAAVAVAIIGVQAVGLRHRIEHATAYGWLFGPLVEQHGHHAVDESHGHPAAELDDGAGDGERAHDCAAIDALALGDTAPGVVVALPARPPAAGRFVAEVTGFTPATVCPFHARAPPAFS